MVESIEVGTENYGRCLDCDGSGWVPCDNHHPRIEIDDQGPYEWCDWCEGTGRVCCDTC